MSISRAWPGNAVIWNVNETVEGVLVSFEFKFTSIETVRSIPSNRVHDVEERVAPDPSIEVVEKQLEGSVLPFREHG